MSEETPLPPQHVNQEPMAIGPYAPPLGPPPGNYQPPSAPMFGPAPVNPLLYGNPTNAGGGTYITIPVHTRPNTRPLTPYPQQPFGPASSVLSGF